MLTGRSTACAAALLLAYASALQASDTTFVSQGARVKVYPAMAGAKSVTGNVADLASDTLVILPEGGGEGQTFLRRNVRKIEVSQGEKSNVGKGAWIGATAGAVCGAIVGATVEDCDPYCGGALALMGAGMFGAGGALVGMGVGALIKTERWKEAQFPAPTSVALNVGQDGSVRLAFSLRL